MIKASSPRFLVAKYARDERRMEPRNFGVVLWHAGRVCAKFAGEPKFEQGKIKPPKSLNVRDKKTYIHWVEYWRQCLAEDELGIGRQPKAKRSSAEYLDALQATSRGNYMLVDGGYVFDPVAPQELPSLLGYLYEELVGTETDEEDKPTEFALLAKSARKVLHSSGIGSREDFSKKWPAPCDIHGVMKSYDFDYALGDTGNPSLLMHKVPLAHEKTFDSFVLNLQGLYASKKSIVRDKVCAMVYINGSSGNTEVQSNLEILGKLAVPVDVHDEGKAESQLRKLVGSPR